MLQRAVSPRNMPLDACTPDSPARNPRAFRDIGVSIGPKSAPSTAAVFTRPRSAACVDATGRPISCRCLEEDKGPDHDVLAASGVGGRGWVDTGSMERPARDGAVDHRVIAFEHRDLGGLLLGKPVPLVVGTVGEAGGLTDAVVIDPVVGDVGLVG